MPGNTHAQGRESLRRKVSAPQHDAPVSVPLPADHAANMATPISTFASSQTPQSSQPAPGGFDFGQASLYPPTSEIGREGGEPSHAVAERIQQHGGGAPLDAPTRTTMERAFGHNFGDVRIFADGEADQLNRSISA